MYAIKNDEVILSGSRNCHDRLWDVPLSYQYSNDITKMHTDNYKTSAPYAGLYNRHVPLIPTPTKDPVAPKNVPSAVSYNFEFQDMNELIDDTQDYLYIDKQMKIDRKSSGYQQANVIIRKNQTKSTLVEFLHAACYAPTKATFLKAIKNNHFVSWPGLDPRTVAKHLGISEYTVKGHMARERSNLQSTKNKSPKCGFDDLELKLQEKDTFPPASEPNEKTNEVAYQLLTTSSQSGKAYMDMTGEFPVRSSRGNQ